MDRTFIIPVLWRATTRGRYLADTDVSRETAKLTRVLENRPPYQFSRPQG
ncbi:MAG: hypothetical protein HYW88_02560 [Candidatus Sungbacteria bacterium]|nr:hypothetical protein [Candidatus Sungbacteria bacterium]